jgi:microcystin-dependent protein
VPYTKAYAGGWQNGSGGSTPIDAAALNTMEAGIQTAYNNFQIQATAPIGPSVGQLWFNTSTGTLNFWSGSAWVSPTPVGTIQAYAGVAAPDGWLFCSGTAGTTVTQAAYPALFAVLTNSGASFPYGGSGTTTYTPDLRGRTIAALDNMSGSDAARLDLANTLGTAAGSQYHTLSVAELASHNHGVSASASVGVSGADDNNHTGNGDFVADSDAGYKTQRGVSLSISILNNGSGSPHNNMQPTMLLNYIIKT